MSQNRILKRMRKSQTKSGNQPMPKIWAKVNSYNRFLVNDTVNVLFEYGTLIISKENDEYFMTGPAERIADNINFNF